MAEVKTNLLTEADYEYIRDVGLPMGDDDSLWLRTTDTGILMTLKGRQYLAEVSRIHRTPLLAEAISSYSGLCLFRFQVTCAIDEVEIAQAQQLLNVGLPSRQDYEYLQAFASGTNQEFLAAAERKVVYAKAGPNIIPLGKKRI